MSTKRDNMTRRSFLTSAGAAAAFTIVPRHVLGGPGFIAPSDKLNIACIGVGGRGGAQINGCSGENIVALVDVDQVRAGDNFNKFPGAKKYTDFRKMFDEMTDKIDAVCVSTPDHTHSVAVMAALKRGKHVYCEKPLAHSIWEIRQIMAEAKKQDVVTQLGNQGHSFDSIRRCCEWIWDGAVGDVHTVHARCDANHNKVNLFGQRSNIVAVPKELDWDLWQGPARARQFEPMYIRGAWRGWSPYGSGTIGDWICHVVDPVFWALDLGSPTSVRAECEGYDPVAHADTFPEKAKVVFEFAATKKRNAVVLVWHSAKEEIPQPPQLEPGRKPPRTGAVVYGTQGQLSYGSHGAGDVALFPEAINRAYDRPAESIPRVKNHHWDWLNAIRTGKKSGSDIPTYGGPLTELARLGIIAYHFPQQKLLWDGPNMKFTNNNDANKLIKPEFREGWSL
ncbi:MAG: Gfo/Idh/MocA family oxidoreductase [Phycisphaerae bacterium]|nr:Gfo/Idh/MocA family oxidoreductase [Phycisphaerae bacterium]